jgi:hypothetical protein
VAPGGIRTCDRQVRSPNRCIPARNDASGNMVVLQGFLVLASRLAEEPWTWHSSTNPASNARAASSAPPTMRSRPARDFICRTALGSKSRSIRVLAVDIASSVVVVDLRMQLGPRSYAHGSVTGILAAVLGRGLGPSTRI